MPHDDLIPPRYVVVPRVLVYGDLPRAIAYTGLRIWGLGWRHRYERTDPIRFERLCKICRASRSKLYEHLGRLVATGVLRYTNTGGELTFTFPRLLEDADARTSGPDARAGPSPGFWTRRTVVVVGDPTSEAEGSQQHQYSSCLVGGSGGEGGQSRFLDSPADPRAKILDELHVMEPTRSELLGLDHVDEEYLQEWADWFLSQDELGVGWLVVQLRAGMLPPEDERSRMRDGLRYVTGPFAEFIQH